MPQAFSRRDFIARLVPLRLTPKRVGYLARGAFYCLIGIVVLNVVRGVTWRSGITIAGYALAVLGVLVFLSYLISSISRLVARGPLWFRSGLCVGLELGASLVFAWGVIHVYERYKSGAGLADTLIAVGAWMIVRYQKFISDQANKSLQPTPTAVTPPAAQEIVPAVGVAEH